MRLLFILPIGASDSSKMVPIANRRYVQGYEAFVEFTNNYMNDHKDDTPPYILFTGTKLPDTGKSWCPDCVAGESLFFPST